MNNSIVFLTMFGIFCATLGLFTTRLHTLVMAIFEQKRRRKKFPYVESADQDLLCKNLHKWDKTKLVFTGLPVDNYTVCTECGFISGTDWKLNGPALEVYHNHLKRRDAMKAKLEAALIKKQLMINEIMNKTIKSHVADLGLDLSKNIEVLQQFFRKSMIEVESVYSTLNEELKEDG